MDFGSIAAKMTLDISNFTSQLNLAQNQAQRLAVETSKSFQIGSALTGMGKVLSAAVTLPLLGIAATSIKVGNEFQAQMSRVQAIAGATGGELDQMKRQAIELGAKTAFSAKEAAQGMENLASAGFQVNEIMDAMPGVLDLAAVSGGDVAASSEAMASSLRAFGLEAGQAGHVADVFARAAADTNAETVDMAEAMKYVAPVAHSMGLSLEETAASIGIMADAGIKGSQAGTTLRGALSRIAKPTKAMVKSMDQLGVSFYDANGKMIPLREQIAQLKTATAGLTQEERNRHLVTLYGQNSLSGMLALLDAGPEKLDKMTNALINSDGAAREMAETMQDNLASKIEQMGGAFESAAIVIQQILEPALTKVVGGITKLIEAFLNMSPVGQKMVVIFAGMVAALGPLLLIAGTVMTTMVKLRIAMQFLGPAFMGTMGTIALVVATFYALVAVLMIAYTKSEKFRNFIDSLAPAIKKGLGVAVEWTAEKLKVLWEWLQKVTEKVKEFGSAISSKVANTLQQFGINLGQAGSSIGSFISSGLERLGGAFGKVGGVMSIAASVLTKVGLAFFGITGPLGLVISLVVSFLTAWARTGELNADGITQVFDNLTSTIQGAADAINQYLPIFVQKGTEILVKLIEGIANAIPGVVSVISQVIESLVQTISTVLPTILAAGVQILTALINGIAQALPTIIQAAIQIIMALFNGLIQALPTIISAAIQIIQALIQGLVEALPAIIEAALQIITGLVQGLIQALPMILEAALQIIMGLVNALIENIGPILEAGIQILMALIQGLIQMIPELIVAAIEIITTLLTSILSNLPQLLEAGVKLLLALIQGLIQMIPQLLAGAIQIMMALLKAIVDYVPKLLQAGVQLLQALIQGIASLIGSLVSTIASMMGQVVSKIASFLGQMLSGGANLIRNLISGIGSMIGSVVGKIGSMGSSMISCVTGFAGQMVSAGVNLVQGFINGIGSMVSSAVNAAANMASSALNAVKGFLGIHSPSRVMEKMGVYTGQGFVNGIGNMIRTTRDKAIEMASTVTDALSNVKMNIQENGVVQKVKDVFEQIVDEMPDELPKPGFGKVLDAIRTPEVDLYGNKDKDPDKPQGGGASGGKDHTTISIGTIVVRNNDDVDKLSRGLYNKSKETLSGFGNIVTP
nr:MAG TPA: minor tail protein [Caudoviricetes sp.]